MSKGRETVYQQLPAPQNLAAEQAAANRITQFSPAGNLFFGQFDAPSGEFTPESGRALRVQETPAQSAIRQLQEIGGTELAATGASDIGWAVASQPIDSGRITGTSCVRSLRC